MKIAIICSSLEPEKDGVGDYTRLLANACSSMGHPCSIIALNDRHCAEVGQSELPVEPSQPAPGGNTIPVLRLPATMPWPQRLKLAVAFRDRFQPDWISLQFVSYGFSKKGIPWRLADRFRQITDGYPLHLMCHELWIGVGARSPLKHRLVGMLQRAAVLRMIRALGPRVIHTSIPNYVAMLKNGAVEAATLPLFGNIPVATDGDRSWLWERLKSAGCDIEGQARDSFWLAGFFGSLYDGWTPEPLFGTIRQAAKKTGKRVCFIAAGRLGHEGDALWDRMAAEYLNEFFFLNLGELEPGRISQFFQLIDFGIATTPWRLIGKSGAAAAMADHGLPIIVTRGLDEDRGVDTAGFALESLLEPCNSTLKARLIAGLPRRKPEQQIGKVARKFLSELVL